MDKPLLSICKTNSLTEIFNYLKISNLKYLWNIFYKIVV